MIQKPNSNDKKNKDKECITNVFCCEDKVKNECCCKEKKCCCFDIYVSRIKAKKNHDGYSEAMIIGYANGQAAPLTGLGSWLIIHKKQGWVNINKFIMRICKPNDESSFSVAVTADAIEVDRMGGGNWERGSAQEIKNLELICGKVAVPQSVKVECKKVKNLLAGNVTSEFEVEFTAYPANNC